MTAAALTQAIESLRESAAECESWADQPGTPDWERAWLLNRAEHYRAEQVALMAENPGVDIPVPVVSDELRGFVCVCAFLSLALAITLVCLIGGAR